MRLLVKIWLCAGCLLGIAEWSQARPTEPDTLMRALREAASPTNALIREAYANPATRPDAFRHSLSELSIGYRLQSEEQPTVRQKGDRSDFGYFATEGYRHLSEKSTLWGHAGYRIGKRRNVVWNLASDYELIYPAITTDTVGGGDLTSEEYTFGGGYGHRGERFGWGASADVRAGQEYRTTDPRPRNITIDISATLGGSSMHRPLQGGAFDLAAGLQTDERHLLRQPDRRDGALPADRSGVLLRRPTPATTRIPRATYTEATVSRPRRSCCRPTAARGSS